MQTASMQSRVCVIAGQTAPLLHGVTVTARVRVAVPWPQVVVQAPNDQASVTWQSMSSPAAQRSSWRSESCARPPDTCSLTDPSVLVNAIGAAETAPSRAATEAIFISIETWYDKKRVSQLR